MVAIVQRRLTGNVEFHAVKKRGQHSTRKNKEEMIYVEEGELGHLRASCKWASWMGQ